MPSVIGVAVAVAGNASNGIDPLCGPATGRAVYGPAIRAMAGAGFARPFVANVITGAAIIAANAAQDSAYRIRAFSGRTNSVRAIR
jgi:hypothetical protein